MGVDAGLVGVALLIALIVDAVSDPVVGYWSDNMRTRFGRRHPFMYAALIPTAVTYFLTWNPPAGVSGNDLFIWLLACTILVRLSFTFFDVPSTALAAEIPAIFNQLSPRQLDVARLVGKGQTNYQIACELGITENTVKLYVSQVLRLTHMHNRTQLALALTPNHLGPRHRVTAN